MAYPHPKNPIVIEVTRRIVERSASSRQQYLTSVQSYAARTTSAQRLGCANLAHAFAAMDNTDKTHALQGAATSPSIPITPAHIPNIGVVTAYNDVLSAHAPYERYPAMLRQWAQQFGVTLQVAGGTPAMCDGVTQGETGMELSLFSRDTIARSTAIALSHDIFDGVLLLGICDKIVPGLLIGALQFGHLPMIFVPAGPMTSGLSNADKAKVREQATQGKVGRDALLDAESRAYHAQGTCTFYGTANSNQMLMEAMGLHMPGAAFIQPHSPLRTALTHEALAALARQGSYQVPRIGDMVNECAIVNAMVALLATGGSTNHLIHWVAVAKSAGIHITWDDFSDLSSVVPLLARIYPNGDADVNQFQAAGGPGVVISELIHTGLMHYDVRTVASPTVVAYACNVSLSNGQVLRSPATASLDDSVVRSAQAPFSPTGGLKVLSGNLGRSVIKVSSIPDDRHVIEAPCRIFTSQEALQEAFYAHELERDVVCVVHFQGPHANGMPELHKLTPSLAILQNKGFRVALVTDGRMSGASGKVPAAIHICPESARGGALAKLRDGDVVRLDAVAGTLNALVDSDTWAAREVAMMPAAAVIENDHGMGRDLFRLMRDHVTSAETGACTW